MATGQVHLDSYDDAGVLAAVELVNAFAVGDAFGRPAGVQDPLATIARILVNDPPSVALLRSSDTPGFVALAGRLREVFEDVRGGDVDGAASRLNVLLAEHPAHPHLAKENGQWRLHHHPTDAALVPMYTSICAEGLARIIGAGGSARLGTCEGPACDRVLRRRLEERQPPLLLDGLPEPGEGSRVPPPPGAGTPVGEDRKEHDMADLSAKKREKLASQGLRTSGEGKDEDGEEAVGQLPDAGQEARSQRQGPGGPAAGRRQPHQERARADRSQGRQGLGQVS